MLKYQENSDSPEGLGLPCQNGRAAAQIALSRWYARTYDTYFPVFPIDNTLGFVYNTLMNNEDKKDLDEALNFLLDQGMLSMEWNPEKGEMVFYMTDEQHELCEDFLEGGV